MSKPIDQHPVQPVLKTKDGILRCKGNPIVRFLLDAGPFDMNQLACMPFENEDREQFAQLIGYSVSGWLDLSCVSQASRDRIAAQYDVLLAHALAEAEPPPPTYY